MFEFFRGWKRKVGCVALAMTCLFMFAWVRSLLVYDYFAFHRPACTDYVGSFRGDLVWHSQFGDFAGGDDFAVNWTIGDPDTFKTIYDYSRIFDSDWRFKLAGFGLLVLMPIADDPSSVVTKWFVPYWLIVAPLTAVSAWLLLSKPRGTKPTPATPN